MPSQASGKTGGWLLTTSVPCRIAARADSSACVGDACNTQPKGWKKAGHVQPAPHQPEGSRAEGERANETKEVAKEGNRDLRGPRQKCLSPACSTRGAAHVLHVQLYGTPWRAGKKGECTPTKATMMT